MNFAEFQETPLRVNGPGIYRAAITFDTPGTVYMRPHALVDGVSHYGEAISRKVN